MWCVWGDLVGSVCGVCVGSWWAACVVSWCVVECAWLQLVVTCDLVLRPPCVCRSLLTSQMMWQFNEVMLQDMDQLVAQLNAMEPTSDYNARCVCVCVCVCVHARVCMCVCV